MPCCDAAGGLIFASLMERNKMSPKFVLILYYFLPFTAFSQTAVLPHRQLADSIPFGLITYPQNNVFAPESPHYAGPGNYVYDLYHNDSDFPAPCGFARQDGKGFAQYGGDYSRPKGWREAFRQPVYREPISLKGMIRSDGNIMGASAAGVLVYTGGDDVFAYAHYGRTGKLIWRTSPSSIAYNMMATRWSLANFNLFRRGSLSSISDQLK
jgi:hypothetical protein